MPNNNTNIKRSKATIFKYILFTFSFFFLVILGIGEIITRILTPASPYKEKQELDQKLGWKPRANLDLYYGGFDQAGVPAPVHYQTAQDGFRVFGDLNTTKKRVFFVGDSYTQAVEVSNPDLFYSIVADSLDIEIWAFGQAGFGSLQQYLIIEEFIELIKPDLIVLQSCDNDFIDNYAPLEYNSNYKVGLKRPYLNFDGDIERRFPIPKWQENIDKSAFLKLLRQKIKTTFITKEEELSEKLMVTKGRAFDHFDKSCIITKSIVQKIKTVTKGHQLIGFSASGFQPGLGEMNAIYTDLNIPFLIEPCKKIDQAEFYKNTVRSADGYHWNKLGHSIIAENLMEPISSILFPPTEND